MRRFDLGSALFQTLFGILRILLIVVILTLFGWIGSTLFHDADPVQIAEDYRHRIPTYRLWPMFGQLWFAATINEFSFRYLIAPVLAILLVLFAGAWYVRDIYALPSYGVAFRYILASMFSLFYPKLIIDNGKPIIAHKPPNLINLIGGPGSVLVEPGSAAVFRRLRELSLPIVASNYFVAPFERIAQTVSLDEVQATQDRVDAMTRDGIRVILTDVHFRFRIRQINQNGRTVQRTPDNPNPFDPNALTDMIRNLTAGDTWSEAIERAITGVITDFIAEHSIDYLTAPSRDGHDPRSVLQEQIFLSARSALQGYGAELLWIDPGHLEIESGEVGDMRTSAWAAPWMGDSGVKRAFGDQLRQAHRDLGRAQAQAEMVMSITEALSNVRLSGSSPENIRRLLLARTAQILDSLSSKLKD